MCKPEKGLWHLFGRSVQVGSTGWLFLVYLTVAQWPAPENSWKLTAWQGAVFQS